MKSFVLPLLMGGQAAAGAEGGSSSPAWMSMLPFVGIIAIFYFLIIRPQNKKQKETKQMLAALKKGDKVVTIGGLHGTIASVKESTVVLRVDDNVKMEFSRSAISGVEAVAKENKLDQIEDKGESDGSSASGEGADK